MSIVNSARTCVDGSVDPAARDLDGAIDQALLAGRVRHKLLGSFKDAVRLREKLANPAGNKLLDLRGGNAQPAG